MRDQSIAVTAPGHGLRLDQVFYDPRDVMAIDDGAQDEDSALQPARHVQGTGTHNKPQPVQSQQPQPVQSQQPQPVQSQQPQPVHSQQPQPVQSQQSQPVQSQQKPQPVHQPVWDWISASGVPREE